MKIITKGGTWKNTEDEILKASVMKYGLNQWSRISSLIVRKSAKQCKERWYQWLDPQIKKTEWSRDEEEKLLYLAKNMPNQWRSIAPYIGRTASQCIEHYEKLLDFHSNNTSNADSSGRLRSGDIDPMPETKPAMPDPVDMDEDEKEMLSEARARLANTKGKKAKRKAREKQMIEAKRLATLQKKRELRAAGVSVDSQFDKRRSSRKKKKQGIDYNAEIPFQIAPPSGPFDISRDEDIEGDGNEIVSKRGVSLQALESASHSSRKRSADQEAVNERERKRRQIERKERDLPAVVKAINKANDPSPDPSFEGRTSRISLPSPTLEDSELRYVAKLQRKAKERTNKMTSISTSTATDTLLGITSTPMSSLPAGGPTTPVRTPSLGDTVARETKAILQQQASSQTPLLLPNSDSFPNPDRDSGETLPTLFPTVGSELRTPNPLSFSSTPNSSATPISNPRPTEFGTSSLLSSLRSIPSPRNEFQVVLPDKVNPVEEIPSERFLEDADDEIQRKEAEEDMKAKANRSLRSQVIQRGLPVPQHPFFPPCESHPEELITNEMSTLIEIDSGKLSTDQATQFSLSQIQAASDLISSELPAQEFHTEKILQLMDEYSNEEVIKVPISRGRRARKTDSSHFRAPGYNLIVASEASRNQQLDAAKAEFFGSLDSLSHLTNIADRLEKKVDSTLSDFEKESVMLSSELEQLLKQLDSENLKLECCSDLRAKEKNGMPERVEALGRQARMYQAEESRLQLHYKELLRLSEETESICL